MNFQVDHTSFKTSSWMYDLNQAHIWRTNIEKKSYFSNRCFQNSHQITLLLSCKIIQIRFLYIFKPLVLSYFSCGYDTNNYKGLLENAFCITFCITACFPGVTFKRYTHKYKWYARIQRHIVRYCDNAAIFFNHYFSQKYRLITAEMISNF